MARDYKHEYAIRKDKDKRKVVGAQLPAEAVEQFKAKCELDNTTPGTIIKEFVYGYLNNEFTFDGKSIKAQK